MSDGEAAMPAEGAAAPGVGQASGDFADPEEFARQIRAVAEKSQHLVADFLKRQSPGEGLGMASPLAIGAAFFEMTARMMADPSRLVQAQLSLWNDYMTLWQRTAQRFLGGSTEPMIEPPQGDRRFRDAAWRDNTLFDFIKQSYLLAARWLQGTVRDVEGIDERTARKVDFYTRQFVDALAPSNFLMTNPEALRATIESRGENLLAGLKNLLDDLERGKGRLAIRMTDLAAFRIGENIATTPGKVVYQNDLIQLIQYAPATATVNRRPLLIMPPWINKYYVLDLRPENSFIRWAVAQGHTVFVISWVNPDARLAAKTFADYMRRGAARRTRCDPSSDRRARGQRDRLLPGRDPARGHARLYGGQARQADQERHLSGDDGRFRRSGRAFGVHRRGAAGLARSADERQGLSRRSRHGAVLQHAARQRSDLVVRRQQLSARQVGVPVRSPVLECRFDAHAGGDAQLLPAQHVSGEPPDQTRRHQPRRRADRSRQGQDAGVSAVDPRGSHRTVAVDLCRDPDLQGAGQVRVVGLRSHRRRGQPARR